MKHFFTLLITLLIISTSFAQDFSIGEKDTQLKDPISWTTSLEKINDKEYFLVFKAKIEDKWHLYSQYNPDGASLPIEFDSEQKDSLFTFVGKALESETHKEYSKTWEKEETFFSKNATLKQRIKLLKDVTNIEASIYGQVCKESCIQVEHTGKFDLSKATAVTQMKASDNTPKKEKKGLWTLFILSFFAGFAALLTPCVFPMIPMTVSFFTKQSKNRAQGIKNAIIYGLAIIVLYVLLGVFVSAVFGPEKMHELSTNPWFNIIFFVILIIFAVSFLGAFEIMLPNSWANKVDAQADRGGITGIFFMALALAIVSFSCTGPIVSTALITASKQGEFIAPILSMLGFSLAIALPFALFAAFPGWLNSLPKSGGWLNTVKVVLGFLELALAFKFLSNADMAWETHWIDREIFLAIWIAIFGILALYLFGKIQLPHDSPLKHLSVGRLLLGILSLTFVIYLLPGMWGAPLKLISGLPPSISKYSESPYGVGYQKLGSGIGSVSHNDLPEGAHLMKPNDIISFEDYDIGLAYAKKVGKPILLDFTGNNCANCRRMEENVWPDESILPILKNEVVLISLYVDDKNLLPKEKQFKSKSGKKIKTYGQKWIDFQMEKYKANAQPYYVLIDHNENTLNGFATYNPSVELYENWLKKGIAAFKNK